MTNNSHIKILVVDDDETNRYVKAHILGRSGYLMLEAARGADAIRMVREEQPALVLLDVNLPDISGIEVSRQIKAIRPQLLVLQTSAAFTNAQDRVTGLESGADAYLVEPIEPDELTATVAALLRMYTAEQALISLNETLEERVAERTRDLAEANRSLADLSAQRLQAEEALRHAQKLDAVGQLTGGVAHDFNNLLTVIIGNLDMIDQGLSRARMPAGQIKRLVGVAQRAALDCERLTRQLLAFARRDVLRLELVDLNELIGHLESFLKRAVSERITLEVSLADFLGPCRLDVGQFEAAMLNLAVNARDAMPAGGSVGIVTRDVIIRADAVPEARIFLPTAIEPGSYVSIAVTDQGCGISDDALAHAFEPFFTTKDVGQGSGLGLSQVYGFVHQSNGYVAIDTTVDTGTTVTIYLPRAEGLPTSRRVAETRPSAAPGGSETILIVEDNDMVIELTTAIVEELGYSVLQAADGPTALEIIRDHESIDLLFTDITMPNRISGIELARQARELRPEIKVLITSGYSAHGRARASVSDEFPFIPKPYRSNDLARHIREALGH